MLKENVESRFYVPKLSRDDSLVYLDNIMITTQNYTEHFPILKEVFRLAPKHNLQFQLDKCFFGFEEV